MSGNERPKYDASRDEQPDALPPHSPLGDVALLTRREFVAGALASTLLPDLRASTWLDQAKEETPLRPTKIGEIASTNGRLRAVITVRNEDRRIAADPNVNMPERTAMLRYFEGKDADGNVVWPPPGSAGALRSPLPGPTLRAQLGDQIEITYLNQIDVSQFPKGTIDLAETGELTPCAPTKDTEGVKLYPEGAGDHFPNCFHGSSTVNMHFHGTHVTPDGLGDNVLLQLRPRPDITEAAVRQDFERIFAAGPPGRWSDLPRSWQEKQLRWLKEYDDTAVWQGVRGTPGHPALPPANRLLPRAQAFIANGYWPQYQVGAYPFCFKITEYSEDAAGRPVHYAMGQCPGTHWYHAHKHGSTAINVLNGMAGVFIIEGGYDAALKKLYPDLKRTEQVLIVQNFSDRPNLLSQVVFGQAPSLWVNSRTRITIASQFFSS